jgi:hypothetical protein
MGATDFETTACGKSAAEAFRSAVERAQYDHGHAGYTGTVAEKDDFRVVDGEGAPSDAYKAVGYLQTAAYAEELADSSDPEDQKASAARLIKIPRKYRRWAQLNAPDLDKWGPAACLEVTNKRQAARLKAALGYKGKRGIKVYIFFGEASC